MYRLEQSGRKKLNCLTWIKVEFPKLLNSTSFLQISALIACAAAMSCGDHEPISQSRIRGLTVQGVSPGIFARTMTLF